MITFREIIVKGPVLGPGWIGRPELGLEDRPLTPAEIQKAAYNFLPGTPLGPPMMDANHDLIKQEAEVVESFVTSGPYEFNNMVYPAGTWFLTSKVTDPKLQEGILNGTFTGYSVGAWPEEYKDRLVAKGLFKDVAEGAWFPLTVSFATLPYYKEAVFKVFGPDDFIKKNIPNMEVDNLTNKEESGLASVVNKLLDIVINKEAKASEVEEESKFITEEKLKEELDARDEKLGERFDKIEELLTKEEVEEEEETEETEEEEETTEETTETEESEDDSEDNVAISKAIPIDEAKAKPEGTKSFMEQCGCDALGRNPKYL